jgi:hypothetical protein
MALLFYVPKISDFFIPDLAAGFTPLRAYRF